MTTGKMQIYVFLYMALRLILWFGGFVHPNIWNADMQLNVDDRSGRAFR